MKILVGGKWKEGFLDHHRDPDSYRIEVIAWKTLEELRDVYHVRPKSLRLLWNYLPVMGPVGMWRKIWSRLREEYRNEKYVSCGIGRVIEQPGRGRFKEGDVVGFVAPLHPALVERIVLPEEVVFEVPPETVPEVPKDSILRLSPGSLHEDAWWKNVRGWTAYSGTPIGAEEKKRLAKGLVAELEAAKWGNATRHGTEGKAPVSEIRGDMPKALPGRKEGVVFGYGNFAKINIIPYTKPFVDVRTAHEIDPTQIVWEQRIERWDTSPMPREGEKHDVYFIASFNHTHAPIALRALEQGAHILMEKPIATDGDQLTKLLRAVETHGEKLFIGFQKRYSKFNDYAREDLAAAPGDPISYHCIVFELTQPKFFWYNWPNSRSCLFSNGCHQVDHFLYLNDWSEPMSTKVSLAKEGSVNVEMELENGAYFTMVFSEKGSARIGPRDHIELKTNGRNVRITDATHYFSESETETLRTDRVYKTEAYRTMYRTVAQKIAQGENGDSLRSLRLSAEAMFEIERQYIKALGKKNLTRIQK